jgi:non-heme chloroperoxidase
MSRRQANLLKNAKLIELKDGPHGVPWTHAQQVNEALVEFLG